MSILDRVLASFSKGASERLYGVPSPEALRFELRNKAPEDEHWEVSSPLAVHTLRELEAAGLADVEGDGFSLGWNSLYAALVDEDRTSLVGVLAIPDMGSLRPRLRSANALSDADFEVAIDGWLNDAGQVEATKLGAVARTKAGLELLPRVTFDLANAIDAFWSEQPRTSDSNRTHWGRIRALAAEARAGLDQFLAHTIVLTPEKLQIRLLETDVAELGVVEVQPWFVGAPENWLATFDIWSNVRDRYELTTGEGLVEVQITPKVKTILQAIKRMPGRRTSGVAAERFLHNPYAALGPDAVAVIDEEQFNEARREAGVDFERFSARVSMTYGSIKSVGIAVERLTEDYGSSTYEEFDAPAELRKFIAKVEARLQAGTPLCEWRRHRLELTGDVGTELDILKAALIEWTKPKIDIRAADVHDLEHYSKRVHGIGIQPKIVSPYIPTQSGDDPWFPESPGTSGSTVAVTVPLEGDRTLELIVDAKVFRTIQSAVETAEAGGRETIALPGNPSPTPIPIKIAKGILSELAPSFSGTTPGDPAPSDSSNLQRQSRQRKELLLRANIQQPEFVEDRAQELKLPDDAAPRLPAGLVPEYLLKEHQLQGVAWLQNLFAKAPDQCRGAVLADDMGLGKTLQLLALVCRAFEENSDLEPVLIVAPVSLLENWQEEAKRFFGDNCPRILTLYGSKLDSARAPRSSIEQELLDEGISRFLKPGWRDDAQIVLTTYDTLRDLEFSFAAERWSMMICDEAQKIKNPAAMVTRAAKKQNVTFRIACTGTPVENSLADLWCLFDFIQPGLLGALNEFGAIYRRPIECETEEQAARIEQLRVLIEPQILRRTKADVADLPPKVVVQEPRQELSLSAYQRDLYGLALEQFKLRNEPGNATPFKNHLGLLQYLRRICVAPPVSDRSNGEPLASYRRKNPKIDWLIRTLHIIRSQGEKVIVFCEFKDIQVLLAHYIDGEFDFRPDIINGDTEAAASAANSRQKRIKRFQEAPGFGVLILSPVAVGFGVNIQAANHVVHFSRTWNPAKEDQATDRAYRIGQSKPVYVYYPVLRAGDFTTFDVKLDLLLEKKRSLSGDMLNGCGDLKPDDFGEVVGIDERVFDQRITLDDALGMAPREFEALIAAIWQKKGFRTVTLTPSSGDGGVDVMAKTVNSGELIQCKSSRSEGAQLSWDAIKDVVTGMAKYRKENPGVTFAKVAVTNQYFNANARYQATLNEVCLIEQADLDQLLKEHAVYRGAVERFMAASR
jgi:hypothetical protein